MPTPKGPRAKCQVCGRDIPAKSKRRNYCSERCHRAQRLQRNRQLSAVYLASETVRPEMQATRTVRVACMAALARLGLPVTLPLPADLLD